ncbi:MAG: mitochondrial fission ELM1 family protein [Geminicoccaceae bacterium]
MLADDRPGNVNQALGLAEALDEPFVVKTIGYSQVARLPNWLLPANLAGLTPASRDVLRPPWPDLVIGAGRRTAPIGRWLKQQNPRLYLVQLMWPGSADDFDLIAVPEHDQVPDHPVLLRTVGPPHRLRPALLRAAAAELAPRLAGLPRPYVACLVGGTSKHVTFTPDDAVSLVEGACALASKWGGSLLVTTSRRTGDACYDALAEVLREPHLLHRWRPDGDNPYLGILGSADAVVVSADSASMCTEACAIGKPAYLHAPAAGVPEKFKLLHQRLTDQGCLMPLGAPWFDVNAPPENPANTIAAAIRKLFPRPKGAGTAEPVASNTTAL